MVRLTCVVCIILSSPQLFLWAQANPRDAHGDPLPDGAVLRLGTQRWRHGGKVRQAGFIDNQTLLTCGEDLALRVWDVATGKQIRQMEGGRNERFALSADRKTLVGLSDDYNLTLFEVSSGRALRKFKAGGGAYPIALSPNGNFLAVGRSYDVQIFELDEDKVLHELKLTANALAFSPDNKILAAGVGETIQLWNVSEGKKIADIPGHKERITALAFAPGDVNILLSSAWDRTVRWWDLGARKEIGQVKQGWTTGLGISPDGKTLAVGGARSHPCGEPPPVALLVRCRTDRPATAVCRRGAARRISPAPAASGPGAGSGPPGRRREFAPGGRPLRRSPRSDRASISPYDYPPGAAECDRRKQKFN
jgi:hypothetical protein